MFDWLGRDPNETLSAYFVPFRSPSLKTLTRSRESFAFAVELWRRIFSEVRAPVVVCIGADVEKRLYAVLGKPDSTVTLPVGWGMRWLGSVATSSVSYCDYRTCRGFEYSAEQLPLSPCGSFVPSLPDTAPSLTFPFRGGTSD